MTDFPASEEAAHGAAALAPPSLKLRCDLALGRSLFRKERPAEAAELLVRVADHPATDYETRVVALMLLAPAMLYSGSFDGAARRFEELLALTAGAGDTFHLAAAYMNRGALWMQLNDMERMAADTERAITYARALGHATLERRSLFNMAEALLWNGSLEEAHRLARRARGLQLQYLGDAPDPWEALLLARVACARGELDEARECLSWIRTSCAPEALAPLQRTLMHGCELAVAGGTAEEWDHFEREVRRVATEFPDEHRREAIRLRRQ
jgi:tetratricopeptide (TPR) repeat protein